MKNNWNLGNWDSEAWLFKLPDGWIGSFPLCVMDIITRVETQIWEPVFSAAFDFGWKATLQTRSLAHCWIKAQDFAEGYFRLNWKGLLSKDQTWNRVACLSWYWTCSSQQEKLDGMLSSVVTFSRFHFRATLVGSLMGLYAMLIIVLGLVFPLSFFLSKGDRQSGVYLSVCKIYNKSDS